MTIEQRARIASLVQETVLQLRCALTAAIEHRELVQWAAAVVEQDAELLAIHHPTAAAVLESVHNAEPLSAALRHVELRTYLNWLEEGVCFNGTEDDLVVLSMSPADIGIRLGRDPVLCWERGLGWIWFLQFASPATGRVFVVGSATEGSGRTGVKAQASDDPRDALPDLFETLGLRGDEVVRLGPTARDVPFPRWQLSRASGGTEHEIAVFVSYSALQEALRESDAPETLRWRMVPA
jgi:hypothetical protein